MDPDFQPEAGGWNAVRELDPKWLKWLTPPVGTPVVIFLYWISNLRASEISFLTLLIAFIGFFLLIPVHECIHALFLTGSLFKDAVVLGYWKEKNILYTHYEGEMKKGRFLLGMFAPLLCISIVPIAVLAVLESISRY